MNKQEIIETYESRRMTIRQIAESCDKSYSNVRRILVEAGYSNGLKKR